MEQIIAYKPKCGCKNKTYRTKSGCLSHEKWCIHNPENHSCPTCIHNHNTLCELDVLERDGREDYVLHGTVAKHCPYWEYNNE